MPPVLSEEFSFEAAGYAVRPLRAQDLPDLQAMIERSADYTWLLTGGPPGPSGAEKLFNDRPPEASPQDKILLGVRAENNKLVGVLDAVRNYPQAGSWFLGLLLIEPAHRGRGLGRRVYRGFEALAAGHGVAAIFLGVVAENHAGLRFWESLGFTEVERRPGRQFARKAHTVIILKRDLESRL